MVSPEPKVIAQGVKVALLRRGCIAQLMADILSFGAGLVGTYICQQLQEAGHTVTAVALNHQAVPLLREVRDGLTFKIVEKDAFIFLEQCDLESYDLILNLLPGDIGDSLREPLISAGATVCDLAFSGERAERFAPLAEERGAAMIHDCGIAPGVSNMIVVSEQAGRAPMRSIRIRVGGNPVHPDDGWSYCAPFSPTDVLAEYRRPTRIRVDGETREVPALSDRHLFEAGCRGRMEAFLTDGLRSLLQNRKVTAQSLTEYTVRWPGHIEKFIRLRDNGGISADDLVQQWAWETCIGEFTYMDITFTDIAGEVIRWEFDIPGIDREAGRLWPSMAIATGIPFIVACEALIRGEISGVVSPDEYIGGLGVIIERLTAAGATITRS